MLKLKLYLWAQSYSSKIVNLVQLDKRHLRVPFLFVTFWKFKMRLFYLISFISLLSGCAQLINGQEQPVINKNSKDGVFYTTCSGAVEHWASCYNKASRTCGKGYVITEKTENANGGFRTMTFECKK